MLGKLKRQGLRESKMQKRDDLSTILPYLPLVFRSSSLLWPPSVEEALKAMSEGPIHSLVDSGEVLSLAISDMRQSLCFPSHPLVPSASKGYAIFFDELISKEDSTRWFGKVVPALANLLLRLPSLLETHYYYADNIVCGVRTGLRILGSQEAGIVYLSQELIGALLACSFFCLFPVTNRSVKKIPAINFDQLFACLHESYSENIESKIRCIVHYFERICSSMPLGVVSFERRVLSTEHHHFLSAYPAADLWSKSALPLCPFEVHRSGLIEDQSGEALEVDFANEYLGGGALHRGCLQEEIRFMINPELIAGMLFLPAMDDNEAIEIVGVERFSNYTGYASLFRFAGDFTDLRPKDSIGRRKTRIVAIDALCGVKTRQFKLKYLLREINKAFCGFLHHCNHSQHENKCHVKKLKESGNPNLSLIEAPLLRETPLSCFKTHQQQPVNQAVQNSDDRWTQCMDHQEKIGVATGNWGCGAFGGDQELKAMIQWLAASQAERPYVAYYTFGIAALQNLEQVTKWILYHEWTVGDLWNMLLEYSMQRFNEETGLCFFSWLLPTK